MKYKKLFFITLLLLFVLLNYNLISQIKLPITLPRDRTALEAIVTGKPVKYRLTIEYSITKKIVAYANHSFLLPIPSSNDFQEVTILETNFSINKIARDKIGNAVLITDGIPPNILNSYLIVKCEITVFPIKYSIPISYKYEGKINKILLSNVVKAKLPDINMMKTKCQNIMDNSIDNMYLKFMDAIEKFKGKFTLGNNNIDKIYDPNIMSLYPIERTQYYLGMLSFIKKIKKHHIYARMGHGWSFPTGIDNIVSSSMVEFFLPDDGMLILNNKLDLFKGNASYINWFYYLPQKERQTNFGYIGIKMANEVISTNGVIWVSGGRLDENNNLEKIYKNLVKIEMTDIYDSESFSSFILENTELTDATHDDNNFVLISKGTSGRIYNEQIFNKYIDKVITCKNVDKGKPISPQDKFDRYSTIYAFIKYSDRKTKKIMHYKWIKPSGKVIYQKSVEIPAKWGYYYITLNKGKNKLEKGLWRIEITINGKLDYRKEFLIE